MTFAHVDDTEAGEQFLTHSVLLKMKVCIAAGDVDPVSSMEVVQHDLKPRRTVSKVAVSAPL